MFLSISIILSNIQKITIFISVIVVLAPPLILSNPFARAPPVSFGRTWFVEFPFFPMYINNKNPCGLMENLVSIF